MNVASFIARRIAFNRQKSFSRFIIRLATVATAISVAAMIISSSFVNGFQHAISDKIYNFWGHIRVQQFEPIKALVAEETPLEQNMLVDSILQQNPQIRKYQAFATKSAVIEHKKDIEGILIKGVDQGYDFSNLQRFQAGGRWLSFQDSSYSKEIVISKPIADELKIKLGDTVSVYFITSASQPAQRRSLKVVGFYKTGIEEYDKLFALADLRLIRRINNWNKNEIGGYEVFLKDPGNMNAIASQLYQVLPDTWVAKTIQEVYPNIFDWLNIQDVNKQVIYIIMAIVAVINLITCLLILVLERTPMTGVLKSLGSSNWVIQKVFLYHSSLIAIRGVLFGLILGLGICWLQQYTGLLKLDESAYYIRVAPVMINWYQVILIASGTFLVCYLALLIPTFFVKKIQPVRAIKFN
ncbi:lipoprotein-releasing system permease protein [Arachidicoccus rhizosphaerae]|jgi:lipoprotein-releasing system permease protein|uniref:Lipoprotein-releasing system permease protein n=1 Tax=Arachidicoccus rhizosphaerae TaxID=551991 RepID=A0A1H4AXI4_9BACT|nr:ABC transporter permease [Arachidicoccus rhizosphaerae]SEA40498.1 lipoprotein-releasing system permease protein [Arachidicoccus rhizosphaerae]